MTHAEAARLICGRCRDGDEAKPLPGCHHFYHGNVAPGVPCPATPIWVDKQAMAALYGWNQ